MEKMSYPSDCIINKIVRCICLCHCVKHSPKFIIHLKNALGSLKIRINTKHEGKTL